MTPDSNKPRLPKPSRRPGFQGWLVAGLVLAMLSIVFFGRGGSTEQIRLPQLFAMAQQHEIQNVTVVNDKVVEVTLTKDCLLYTSPSPRD